MRANGTKRSESDGFGGQVVLEQVERENKERVELLYRKAKQIKEMTITIKDHLEAESRNELSQMDRTFLESNPMIGRLKSRCY